MPKTIDGLLNNKNIKDFKNENIITCMENKNLNVFFFIKGDEGISSNLGSYTPLSNYNLFHQLLD